MAAALNAELAALADAGCPFVQVEEDDAIEIGVDEAERTLFREAHEQLLDGLPDAGSGFHRSLAISGGNADLAGPETFFTARYESYLFDLIDGPDNWRLITRAPRERGIVCGAVDAHDPRIDDKELVIWAASYAASGGRGYERVGVAPAGSLAGLDPAVARRKIDVLGPSTRIVEARDETPIQSQIDPRAVDSRSAAVGPLDAALGAAAAAPAVRRPDPAQLARLGTVLIVILAGLISVRLFLAVDAASHSSSDTLLGFVPNDLS